MARPAGFLPVVVHPVKSVVAVGEFGGERRNPHAETHPAHQPHGQTGQAVARQGEVTQGERLVGDLGAGLLAAPAGGGLVYLGAEGLFGPRKQDDAP